VAIHDITVPIQVDMPIYAGDPDVELERASSIADGGHANVSKLSMGVHTGTHVDAPVHFIEGAPGMESVSLDALCGPAVVVDTGPWIFGKKVMLPAAVIQRVDLDSQTVVVDRSKDEIKNSPEFDEDAYQEEGYRSQLGSYYYSDTDR